MYTQVYNFLIQLSEYYKLLGEAFKATAFANAANVILESKKIPTTTVPGIGKSSLEEIKEFIKNGTTKRLETLKKEIGKREDLAKVPGVGKEQLSRFNKLGIQTIDDLVAQKDKLGLTDGQLLGLKYIEDLKKRIPRSVTELLCKKLLPADSYTICGSYRRGLETSGDIDILADVHYEEKIRNAVAKNNMGILNDGPNRMTILVKDPQRIVRQMDIKFTKPESMGAALLYFTGSKNFNKGMRGFAKKTGFILNEYGLFTRETKKLVASRTEQEIFKALGLPYIPPTKRENFKLKT